MELVNVHIPNQFLWHRLAQYLSCAQNNLQGLYQSSTPVSSLEAELMPTLYHRCEVLLMQGVVHFQAGRTQQSLNTFRSVLDQDPTHLEVLPMLTWNCLILGLNTDAQYCHQSYRAFHSKNSNPDLYSKICRSLVRHSLLTYLWNCVYTGYLQSIHQFEEQWQSLNLGNAEFDFNILFSVTDFLSGKPQIAKQRMKTLYHQFPQEWLPSFLWSVSAFGEKDLAACDEMITTALKKASHPHRSFIQLIQQAMLSEEG